MRGWTRRAVATGICASGLAPFAVKARSVVTSPPLWRVQGAVGSALLFGQLPVRSDTGWQTPEIMHGFEASQTLWLENPVFSREEAAAWARQRAGAPRLTTAEFLPAQDLARLHAQLGRAGSSEGMFDALPADDLYQRLGAIADARSGADFSRLPERIFREHALATAKPILTEWQGLAEVQNFIPPAPHPTRLQLIRLGLDDFDMAWQIDERLDAWTGGDQQYFERAGAILAHRYPELFSKMSAERNRRLAARLATAMDKPGTHFVCIGIRHVAGPDSIQACLRGLGASVARA